ncbi:unnamed protein product [Rhizophagus irregularis]|uniref:Uncharacterized protein n=1 Tax=Rhizophagus irregularis TaxID=588596 RepID=A0A916DZA0_9GLOM|nr:unnamed protein product [Rhizophagus irregularis]
MLPGLSIKREDVNGKCKTFKKAVWRKEFLLTREPLDIVRISTALFVRVEKGEWTGNLEKEVENFENILQKVLERVPSEDVERKKKFRNFGTGKKLAKRVTTAFEDLCSLSEMEALVIDTEAC